MNVASADASPRPATAAAAAARLWLARALAWALLVGGWLTLGALGRQSMPHAAGGLVPVTLWLAGIGVGLALVAARPFGLGALRAALIAGGMLVALALAVLGRGGATWVLLLAAVAWAVLLVAASCGVQRLRRLSATRPPAPLVPACTGALLAWALAGDVLHPGAALDLAALAWAASACVLAALLPGGSAPARGCAGALFDCSLPVPPPGSWRRVADWPLHAAALGMLPMMASLTFMVEWCGRQGLGSPSADTALHLGAMLVPALCLRHWLRGAGVAALRSLVAALMLAGAVALVWWPGLVGLLAASLLHALAWSLAWAGPMLARDRLTMTQAQPGGAPAAALWRGLLTAGAVLALGLAIDGAGPAVLAAVHTGLAVLALAGLAWSGWRRSMPVARTEEKYP